MKRDSKWFENHIERNHGIAVSLKTPEATTMLLLLAILSELEKANKRK